jgi:hypothetical protein
MMEIRILSPYSNQKGLVFSFQVVLYGCETCYLTLMEEHGLRMFENRILRRVFESVLLCRSGEHALFLFNKQVKKCGKIPKCIMLTPSNR